MEHPAFQDPALTIALAAAAGMLAQTLARHVRVPGIVLLLGTGLLLGPDMELGDLDPLRHPGDGHRPGLARAVGQALRRAGEEVILIDSNQAACEAAEEEGFQTLHGSGLEPDVQERAELDTRAGCLGLTSNEEVNLLFARRCRKDFKVPRIRVAVRRSHLGVSLDGLFLPLVVQRGKRAFPFDESVTFRPGDLLHAAVVEARV